MIEFLPRKVIFDYFSYSMFFHVIILASSFLSFEKIIICFCTIEEDNLEINSGIDMIISHNDD